MLRSRSVREGSLGLFALLGLILFAGAAVWVRGIAFGQRAYEFTVKFANVSGLQLGAPVRFRGMNVGKVTALNPRPDGIAVRLEIASTDLLIPHDSTIQASRYGLIGEGSIEIIPESILPKDLSDLNPHASNCDTQVIICNGDQRIGDTGSELVSSLTDLSKSFEKLNIDNINQTITTIKTASERLIKLSDALSVVAKSSNREIQGLSEALDAIERVSNQTTVLANSINGIVLQNQENVVRTFEETANLMQSLNQIVDENRGITHQTIQSIATTSEELGILARTMQVTVDEINTTLAIADKEKMVQDLESLLANAAETAANLKAVSETINDPTTILMLQETLENARATFANAQKITADLDELTGDPSFRVNIRRLVNGLSNLVSSGDQLEQQVQTAQILHSLSQQLDYQLEAYGTLAINQKNQQPSINEKQTKQPILQSNTPKITENMPKFAK